MERGTNSYMIRSKLGKLKELLLFFASFLFVFALGFSVAFTLSYFFFDFLLVRLAALVDFPFDFTSDFFRIVFCSAVSLLAILDKGVNK